jgi:hypothetical protein
MTKKYHRVTKVYKGVKCRYSHLTDTTSIEASVEARMKNELAWRRVYDNIKRKKSKQLTSTWATATAAFLISAAFRDYRKGWEFELKRL